MYNNIIISKMIVNYLMFKNTFDFLVAFALLIALLPLFVLISIGIKLDSNGTVFFLQNRLGKNGKQYKIVKFRTMYSDNDFKTTATLASDPRITKFGRFLRKTSFDELPQLINIVKGEMSFIGPRPPVPTYPKSFAEYNEYEIKRFNVKPGISGLAAIRQREIHDWNLNIPLDVEYVENLSFKLDVSLFVSSLFVFFRTDNIYSIN
jgi:lipopolysaccharide/colanic/teichoic acid biosynthesis glycosyltransferase